MKNIREKIAVIVKGTTPYNQIDMCYLRPLSYESLSDQKQKDSPRPPSEQSLYFILLPVLEVSDYLPVDERSQHQ